MSSSAVFRYSQCRKCSFVFYFARGFCPSCGSTELFSKDAAGHGILVARTLVHRGPTRTWQLLTPYCLCLVDLDAGFRVMGHGHPDVEICDRVCAETQQITAHSIPFFYKKLILD